MKQPLLAVLLFSVVLAGCADDEFAQFDSHGDQLPDCMADSFPFTPTLLARTVYNDRISLYFQSEADMRSYHDGIVIHIYNPQDLSVGESIPLSTSPDASSTPRAKMYFFSSCAYGNETLDLGGAVRFEQFDPEPKGIITGEFVDAFAVDARTGEERIESLTGSWSFEVRSGPPHEDFFGVPERP